MKLLRALFLLVAVVGLSASQSPGGTDTSVPMGCPSVSCLTQPGYNECTQAGCICDPRTDWCIPRPQPQPQPACPMVSCLTETGYNQCVQAGCTCDPRTDWCVPKKVTGDLDVL